MPHNELSRHRFVPAGFHRAGGVGFALLLAVTLSAQVLPPVVFSEVMYHPVEMPTFDAAGGPMLDLSEDVHEFIELSCPGTNALQLGGWRLQGAIDLVFPTDTVIGGRGFVVAARNPARIAQIYNLPAASVVGPWNGHLANDQGRLRLINPAGDVVEEFSYSSSFPWAGSADALGADFAWTGIDPRPHQSRGRSLERVSVTHPAGDPANWLASPLTAGPSPGRSNAVSRVVPRPVITSFSARQDNNESTMIRAQQLVRIECQFSAVLGLGTPRVEYFVDHPDVVNEPVTSAGMVSMGGTPAGRFWVVVPGHPGRSVVRFRFRAMRSGNDDPVSPRVDDPRGWHAWFVSPYRTGDNPPYDLFLPRTSTNELHTNLLDNPLRGYLPVPGTRPNGRWNNTEPAVLVHDGVVYDVQARFQGNFYRRNPAEHSYKLHFPRYAPFRGQSAIILARRDNATRAVPALYRAAGIPAPVTRPVDLWVNANPMLSRVEIEDLGDKFLQRSLRELPGDLPKPIGSGVGQLWKSDGIENSFGPYGRGDASLLPAIPGFTTVQRHEWTYSSRAGEWRGSAALQTLLANFWAARGPGPGVDGPALRLFLQQNFDVDRTLTYLAVSSWVSAWDDAIQNYHLWRQPDGRWTLLPWEFDGQLGISSNGSATASIFRGEVGDVDNVRGPAWIKDAFFRVMREEYRQRLFLLNHTVLHPANLEPSVFEPFRSFAAKRSASVDEQLGLGVFQRPEMPVNQAPMDGLSMLPPAVLKTSAYRHSASPAPPHTASLWRLRRADDLTGSDGITVLSADALTEFPIPFARLSLGSSYRWQVTYFDAAGHPSAASAETTFVYGTPPGVTNLIPIDSSVNWKFNQSGTDLGSAWRQPGFDDTAWPQGPALLGYETAVLPEPIRTTLATNRSTIYLRRRFSFAGDPANVRLELRQIVDDGCVIYLNGFEVSRTRLTPGTVTHATLASPRIENAVYEGPIPLATTHLLTGENVVAVELHQAATNSSDVVFGLSLSATESLVHGDVILSEVMADNRGSVTNKSGSPDWVEVFNAGSEAVDLGGWALSDDAAVPDRFVFPPRTWIAARERLVIWCDDLVAEPGLHTGFALAASGQIVQLASPDTSGRLVVRDILTFGRQLPDRSISRLEAGEWKLSRPTPGWPNEAVSVESSQGLRLNEWMAAPGPGPDWIEIFNPGLLPVDLGGLFLSDDPVLPRKSPVHQLTFVEARGHLAMIADERPDLPGHAGFKLSSAGERLTLYATDGVTPIDTVNFGPQADGIAEGRLPDGAATIVSFPGTDSPGEVNHVTLTNVVINEVLSHAAPPLEDAIELHNLGSEAMDLGGWWLSDELRVPFKFRIPVGTWLAPGGHVVFYENQFNAQPGNARSFALHAARGDEVFLFAADPAGVLTGERARVSFGPADAGVSFGRHVTSAGTRFVAQARRTLGVDQPATVEEFRTGAGASNSLPRVGPIVISELMYHPPDFGPVDNTADEFIELTNLGDQSVEVEPTDPAAPAWRLRDAVDFRFAPGFTFPAAGRVLVVAFDPATNLAAVVSLRDRYGLDPRLPVVGPFRGKLDNSGDSVELVRTDPTSPPGAGRPDIMMDRVEYADTNPWPLMPDGLGGVLQRKQLATYGNDVANWRSVERGGGPEGDGDGLPDEWEAVHGLNPFDPTDGARDDDGDGFDNRAEYIVGTDPQSASSRLQLLAAMDVAGRVGRLEFPASVGRTYAVWELDPSSANRWFVWTNVVSKGSNEAVIFPLARDGGARFFRLSAPGVW